MSDPPSVPPSLPVQTSLFHQAANFCIWSPLIAIIVNIVTPKIPVHTQTDALINAIIAAVLPVAGIIAGIVALFGLRSYGRKGILWKSIIGLLIWVLLVAAAFPVITMVRDKARKINEQQHPTISRP